MKFKSEIYFSYVTSDHEELMDSAALAADDFETYKIISHDEMVLNSYREYLAINSSSEHNTEYILLNTRIFKNSLRDFIYQVINAEGGDIFEFNLKDCSSVGIKNLKDSLNAVDYDVLLKDSDEEKINKSILSLSSSTFLLSSINTIFKTLINLKKEINRFLDGDSFLDMSYNINCTNNSDLSCLSLNEYEKLIDVMKCFSKSEFDYLNVNLKNRISDLSFFLNLVPVISSNVNDLNRRNNFNHDAFPSIYKFISIIHYESALHALSDKRSMLAFLHAIRAMELYLDGFLIYAGSAKISDYNDKFGNFYKDVFLLNGRPVNGISKKVDEAISIMNARKSKIEKEIKDIVKLRNKFILTHGNIKICKDITNDSITKIYNFIMFLEPVNQKANFEWKVVKKRFHSLINIDMPDLIFNSLFKKYNNI
ncbi:hypothetical protein [Erwinia rhapontici]|uniref:hypothetical protein n=1 Tax=Erwinia rhapontici TaxID=55212 RepID=UPI003BA2BA83